MNVIGLIPARGGSKGLPGKNIRTISGKPLIAWTIETALKSSRIDRLIVSTDDADIGRVAEDYGAEVPFIRPDYLATDDAKSIDVIFHALDWFESQRNLFDKVIVLQPTSPLRSTDDIENAFDTMEKLEARAVVSVCETDHHPWWANTLPEDLNMSDFIRNEALNINRQELPVYYRLNGAIYISEIEYLIKNKGFFGNKTYAYIMPKERSVDIDNIIDFKFAESLIKSG